MSLHSGTTARARRRTLYLMSTAAAALAASSPAMAAPDRAPPITIASAPEPYRATVGVGPVATDPVPITTEITPQPETTVHDLVAVAPQPQIVIANPGTPTTARDPNNVTGIGQMIIDNGGGSVGLCTGTLINPRTVLFAAHCVNTRAATAYGAGSGGTAIGFGFEAYLRNEAAGRPDELGQWLFAGPNQYKTNTASSFFNVSQVRYNPLSLEPAANGFLYGDVATATLDTPASNVPIWAMLFSQLPQPTITAAGTGYNVQIIGYGNNGSATTGSSGGIDFRRRIAENMIGGLTDLKTFETFLFGSSTSPTQNLYFVDFDDPRRGLSGASPFDFNAFRDNARGTNEGITAAGDSGGPLILQNVFNRLVTIGTLSGGYTRFFNGQPANGYGTVSFYQPIYLYWDWIAANNPYRYVSAISGDGNWTDPAHWVVNTDPAYMIIGPNGQLVNGVPNSPGQAKDGRSGQFGEICFQNSTSSDCLNVATGQERTDNTPIGKDGDGVVSAAHIQGWTEGMLEDVSPDAYAGGSAGGSAGSSAATLALPPATLANGLPGATNFVPNNADPSRLTNGIGRYFDVTLSAAGTTTLDSAVTIDRLTIAGADARLRISSTGSLTSLIDVTQVAGVNQVDGVLTSRGDYLLMGGGLLGTGRINAQFTTNVAGAIAPGTAGGIGTLTFAGNLVLASASSYVVDLGSNGFSDKISVISTTFNGGGTPTNGLANLGGRIAFGVAQGSRPRFGDRFTILTSQGGISGAFQQVLPLSAILQPELFYTANDVQVRLNANKYIDVVSANSPVQRAYATLLDRNRAIGALPGLYDILDLETAGSIQSTLEALAPRTEALRSSLGTAAIDNESRLIRDRTLGLKVGDLGGKMAYYGGRMRTTNLSHGMNAAAQPTTDVAAAPEVVATRLPETMSGFLAAGYLNGDSRPMTSAVPGGGRDEFDGWYMAGGLESELGQNGAVGVAVSYTDLDGTTAAGGQSAGGKLVRATVYGKREMGNVYIDGQLGAGLLDTSTRRSGNLPGATATLRSHNSALAITGEAGVGAMFGQTIRVGPRAAIRASYLDFGRISETGGPAALVIDRKAYDSYEGRAELVLNGVGRIRPNVRAAYVHSFSDRPSTFSANFVGGVGSNVLFDLNQEDRNWFEATGGVTIAAGGVDVSLSADTTLMRRDVRNQSYRASINFRF
jgi:hypothetical protein